MISSVGRLVVVKGPKSCWGPLRQLLPLLEPTGRSTRKWIACDSPLGTKLRSKRCRGVPGECCWSRPVRGRFGLASFFRSTPLSAARLLCLRHERSPLVWKMTLRRASRGSFSKSGAGECATSRSSSCGAWSRDHHCAVCRLLRSPSQGRSGILAR